MTNVELTIAVCKVTVAVCYVLFLLLIVPRLDAAARMSKIILFRINLFLFLALSIVTYLHIAYFAYKSLLPTSYYNNSLYMTSVIVHALSGIVTIVFCYNLSKPRVSDSKYYREMIDRVIQEEAKKIVSSSTEKELEDIVRTSKDTQDMAKLLLKAYKNG